MNGEVDSRKSAEEVDDEVETSDVSEDTVVLTEDALDSDNVGDISVEINVEELVAKMEAANGDDTGRQREIKRRLEELREEHDAEAELDSTYNFNLDDEV